MGSVIPGSEVVVGFQATDALLSVLSALEVLADAAMLSNADAAVPRTPGAGASAGTRTAQPQVTGAGTGLGTGLHAGAGLAPRSSSSGGGGMGMELLSVDAGSLVRLMDALWRPVLPALSALLVRSAGMDALMQVR